MELTSGAFLGLLVVATLAAAAAAVVFWGRLAPGRVAAVAGRIGVLIGVNLLVLLTVGAALNDSFGFFADWPDLFGAFQTTPAVSATKEGGSAAAAADAPVAGAQDQAGPVGTPPPNPAAGQAGQRRFEFEVHGRASGLTGHVIVLVPQGYSDPGQAGRRYPVIETFHGYPGTPQQWLDSMSLGDVVDTEVAGGRMTAPVIVAPQVEIPPGRDTECVNGGPGLPAVETWLTVDVPNWVTRTFRVNQKRGSWATAGLSAGGWCAAMAALLHPARYGAALVFGGYFRPQFGQAYRPFPGGLPPRYDLVNLVKTSPPPVAMWVETSHTDKTSYRTSSAFLDAVRAPLSVQRVEYAHAGHSILLWSSLVPDAIQWLETQVPGFRPGA